MCHCRLKAREKKCKQTVVWCKMCARAISQMRAGWARALRQEEAQHVSNNLIYIDSFFLHIIRSGQSRLVSVRVSAGIQFSQYILSHFEAKQHETVWWGFFIFFLSGNVVVAAVVVLSYSIRHVEKKDDGKQKNYAKNYCKSRSTLTVAIGGEKNSARTFDVIESENAKDAVWCCVSIFSGSNLVFLQ